MLTGLPAGIVLAAAGVVYAADARLDEANAHVDQAVALLKAAENPGGKPEFGGHRGKAIALLLQAQKEIQKAKDFADHEKKEPPKPAAPPPKPPGYTK